MTGVVQKYKGENMRVLSYKLNGTFSVLTWDKVQLLDDTGEMVPNVKKIVLTIEAGDVAVLEVETYGVNEDPNATVVCDENGPVISKMTYPVKGVDIDTVSMSLLKSVSGKASDSYLDALRQQRISNISSISELEL